MDTIITLPKNVKRIITTLETAGYSAYIVGGSVRDSLRGKTPKDWDVATSAKPEDVKKLFRRTIDTGLKHGTVTVLEKKDCIEVTTYRIDGKYTDGRRPDDVKFSSDIHEDLARRDFTINAIAYNPLKGIVDPFEGCFDLKNELIKCVGNPKERFEEDSLRMLRGIRFAAQFGYKIQTDTLRAMSAQPSRLSIVSKERVREELSKLLMGDYVEYINLLQEAGLTLYALDAEINIKSISGYIKKCRKDECTRLAVLCKDIPNTDNFLRNLRYDNKTINEVSLLVSQIPVDYSSDRVFVKRLLRKMPLQLIEKIIEIKEILFGVNLTGVLLTGVDIINNNECYDMSALAVNGVDLMKIGVPSGKRVGEVLESLLEMVIHIPEMNVQEVLLKEARGFT